MGRGEEELSVGTCTKNITRDPVGKSMKNGKKQSKFVVGMVRCVLCVLAWGEGEGVRCACVPSSADFAF